MLPQRKKSAGRGGGVVIGAKQDLVLCIGVHTKTVREHRTARVQVRILGLGILMDIAYQAMTTSR